MDLEFYKPYFTRDFLKGPNSLRVLGELLDRNPLRLNADSLILDLGAVPAQDWVWVYLSLDAVAEKELLNGSFRYHAPNDALKFFWRWNG